MATDPLFGIHPDALQFQRQRMELLAANIANADTPGYKARDLDFQKLLSAAQGDVAGSGVTQPTHIPLDSESLRAATVWRVPTQPAADGNTVDTQVEQSQFAQSAVQYQASLGFIDGRLRSLLTAITGQ